MRRQLGSSHVDASVVWLARLPLEPGLGLVDLFPTHLCGCWLEVQFPICLGAKDRLTKTAAKSQGGETEGSELQGSVSAIRVYHHWF